MSYNKSGNADLMDCRITFSPQILVGMEIINGKLAA